MAEETLPIRIVETTTTTNEAGQRVSVRPARYVDADVAEDEAGNAITTVPFEEVDGLITLNSAGQAVPVIPVRIVEGLTALNETGASVSVLALRGAGGTPTPTPTAEEHLTAALADTTAIFAGDFRTDNYRKATTAYTSLATVAGYSFSAGGTSGVMCEVKDQNGTWQSFNSSTPVRLAGLGVQIYPSINNLFDNTASLATHTSSFTFASHFVYCEGSPNAYVSLSGTNLSSPSGRGLEVGQGYPTTINVGSPPQNVTATFNGTVTKLWSGRVATPKRAVITSGTDAERFNDNLRFTSTAVSAFPFSAFARVKVDAATNTRTIFSFGTANINTNSYRVEYNSPNAGKISVITPAGTVTSTLGSLVSTSVTATAFDIMIAVRITATEVKFSFIINPDTAPVTETVTAAVDNSASALPGPTLFIGQNPNPGSQVHGFVEYLAVLPRAVSDAELLQMGTKAPYVSPIPALGLGMNVSPTSYFYGSSTFRDLAQSSALHSSANSNAIAAYGQNAVSGGLAASAVGMGSDGWPTQFPSDGGYLHAVIMPYAGTGYSGNYTFTLTPGVDFDLVGASADFSLVNKDLATGVHTIYSASESLGADRVGNNRFIRLLGTDQGLAAGGAATGVVSKVAPTVGGGKMQWSFKKAGDSDTRKYSDTWFYDKDQWGVSVVRPDPAIVNVPIADANVRIYHSNYLPMSYARWSDKQLPYGHFVKEVSESGRDPWVLFPHEATPTFFAAAMAEIASVKASGRKVYLEVSNEVWNSGTFRQWQDLREAGYAKGYGWSYHVPHISDVWVSPANWSSATAYVVGDRVRQSSGSGNIYRCILNHTNQAVTNTTYWVQEQDGPTATNRMYAHQILEMAEAAKTAFGVNWRDHCVIVFGTQTGSALGSESLAAQFIHPTYGTRLFDYLQGPSGMVAQAPYFLDQTEQAALYATITGGMTSTQVLDAIKAATLTSIDSRIVTMKTRKAAIDALWIQNGLTPPVHGCYEGGPHQVYSAGQTTASFNTRLQDFQFDQRMRDCINYYLTQYKLHIGGPLCYFEDIGLLRTTPANNPYGYWGLKSIAGATGDAESFGAKSLEIAAMHAAGVW